MRLQTQFQLITCLGILGFGVACSDNSNEKNGDGGGGIDVAPGSYDGATSSGGTTSIQATGGKIGAGGQGMGGVVATGGNSGTGGIVKTGGILGMDGGAATGGKIGAGGNSNSGGVVGSGGATAIDGGLGTGGILGTGGASGSGGAIKYDASTPDVVADLPQADTSADLSLLEAGPDLPQADRSPDLGLEDTAVDIPVNHDTAIPDGPASISLDDCFTGLPAPEGTQMVATKSSSNGRYRIRIALDTEDRFGTSGTIPWAMIRLGVEIDGIVTCITNRASLGYVVSHHNCDDTAAATLGTTSYALAAPDRSTTELTINNGVSTVGPIVLTDTACVMARPIGPSLQCSSGGPCS